MRFFIYIADPKVDGFLAELSAAERRALADALQLDANVLEAVPAEHGPRPDEVRFARAEAVARRLEQLGQTAPLEGDKPYVSGTLPLHWGRLRHMHGAVLLRHEAESPVWFAEPSAGLIMVGSASRLLAQPPAATTDHAQRAPSCTYAARRALAELDAVDQRCLEQAFEPTPAPEEGVAIELPDFDRPAPPGAAWMAQLAQRPSELEALPVRRLEFMAKRLASFEWSGGTLVLAAPLYVAMAL